MIEKSNINPAEVGDTVVGSVLGPASQRASECRMASFYVGFPGMNGIQDSIACFISKQTEFNFFMFF